MTSSCHNKTPQSVNRVHISCTVHTANDKNYASGSRIALDYCWVFVWVHFTHSLMEMVVMITAFSEKMGKSFRELFHQGPFQLHALCLCQRDVWCKKYSWIISEQVCPTTLRHASSNGASVHMDNATSNIKSKDENWIEKIPYENISMYGTYYSWKCQT